MIKLGEKVLSFILLFILFSGCAKDKAILEKMEALRSVPIDLCESDLMRIDKDSALAFSKNHQEAPYRMLVYTSSNECSTCAINNLSEWSVMLNLEKENKVEFVFILCPETSKVNHVVNAYHSSGLDHSVFIDTCGVFPQRNPHIPIETAFHTLLIDSKGYVVLAGNPLRNQKIQSLFEKILNEIGVHKEKYL